MKWNQWMNEMKWNTMKCIEHENEWNDMQGHKMSWNYMAWNGMTWKLNEIIWYEWMKCIEHWLTWNGMK